LKKTILPLDFAPIFTDNHQHNQLSDELSRLSAKVKERQGYAVQHDTYFSSDRHLQDSDLGIKSSHSALARLLLQPTLLHGLAASTCPSPTITLPS
jgi:hypothetical protein